MFTYLFHEYFRADEAWKAWGNEQIDAYTFQHTPRDVYTRSMVTSPPYSLSPRPVIIPTISPTSSKNLKRGQQRHTRLTLVARERKRGLVNLHGLSPSALPRYRDRDHSLSLSPLSLTARGQECPLSRACNLLDGRSPRRGSWKTSAFQPSNRGVIRYSCRVLCEIRSPL